MCLDSLVFWLFPIARISSGHTGCGQGKGEQGDNPKNNEEGFQVANVYVSIEMSEMVDGVHIYNLTASTANM